MPTEGAKRVMAGGTTALVAALLVMAMPASAAQYVEKDETNLAKTSAKVPCPAGTHVTGGGESTNFAYDWFQLVASVPYDSGDADALPDDGWLVRYRVFPHGYTGSVDVNAVCTSELPDYRSVAFGSPPDSRTKKAVRCDAAEHAYSGGGQGGFLVSVLPKDGPDADAEPDDRFQAIVDNPTDVTLAGQVVAICGAADPDYVTATGPAPVHNGDEVGADCPGGVSLVGGGTGISAPFLMGRISTLYAYTDLAGYGGYADNFTGSPKRIKTIAVCANVT